MPVFNNLSELGKFQLSQASSSSMKFNLPVLKLSNKESPSSNSLSEFANLQLKNYQKKDAEVEQKFAIPNIFASKPSVNTCQIQTIDLKSALLSDREKKEIPKEIKVTKKKSNEKFIPQFIDCEEVSSTKLSHNCENTVICSTTLHDLLREKSPVNQPSIVGKIIGKRFHKKVPYIRHSYDSLQDINRFKFDVPSPDDQILAHLKKK